jgi:hypothetical protein
MGRFADLDDVTSRFEGIIPSDREDWVETRITDVEAVLTGLVPSLEEDDSVIGSARLARVKTSGPYSESITFLAQRGVGGISFTADELRTVRLRNRRTNLGTTKLGPWRPERDPVLRRYGIC